MWDLGGWKDRFLSFQKEIAAALGSAVLDLGLHSALLPPHGDSAHLGCCHIQKHSMETLDELQCAGLVFML